MLAAEGALASPNFDLTRINLAFENNPNLAAMAATIMPQYRFPQSLSSPNVETSFRQHAER
jgi:hypothetical protein